MCAVFGLGPHTTPIRTTARVTKPPVEPVLSPEPFPPHRVRPIYIFEMGLLRTASAVAAATVLGLASSSAAVAQPFPDVIPLPDTWQAEGIATGPGSTVYAGSLANGAVWAGDLRTGEGSVLVEGGAGRFAVGLKYSNGLLFVAGGPTGLASVYDARTGAEVAVYQLCPAGTCFVNDVVVTPDAAWFTDSSNAVLYRLPLRGGRPTGSPTAVPLTGEWQQVPGFNANGIAATPDGQTLLVVNSTLGVVYTVDAETGVASAVDADTSLTSGDGILLQGRTLSVVRNRLNQVAVLRLSPDLTTARLTTTLTDPDFAVPTTIAAFGGNLYAVNALFGTPPPAPYAIVRVDGS
jgi:sugar lactone lactonase YvrE